MNILAKLAQVRLLSSSYFTSPTFWIINEKSESIIL